MSAAIRRMIAKQAIQDERIRQLIYDMAEAEGESPAAVCLTGAEYAAYGREESFEDIP